MPGKTTLENIFTEMSYPNLTQEDLANNISSWIPNNTISSIVNGKWRKVASSDATISIKNSKLKVAVLGPVLDLSKPLGSKEDVPVDISSAKSSDYDMLVSRSLSAPLWQVEGYPKVGTILCPEVSTFLNVEKYGALIDVDASLSTFLLQDVCTLLENIPTSNTKKFVVVVNIADGEDIFRFLPILYKICVLNQKMTMNPVDILIFKEVPEETKKSLLGLHGGLKQLKALRSCVEGQNNFEIVSGGFDQRSFGHADHFIVDSSADLQNAVEAISKKVWLTGSDKGKLYRSLLFVHQSSYKTIINLLELKINSFKISESWTRDSDFVKIPMKMASLPSGIKVLPLDGDLRGPTVVYDIGTSSDLVASTFPSIGFGHLLIVLPYRSNAELLSLANNHGSQNDVFLFSNNLKDIKEICKSIKGQMIQVNTCSKNSSERSLSYACGLVTEPKLQKGNTGYLNKGYIDNAIKKAESIKTSISKLPKREISQEINDSENFVIRLDKPIGLCGVVLVNTGLVKEEIIQLLRRITNAGNVVVVVCVGSKLEDGFFKNPDGTSNVSQSVILVDSVAANVNETFSLLSKSGKIQLAVMYHKDASVNVGHLKSFNNVSVTLSGEIRDDLLYTSKVIYM